MPLLYFFTDPRDRRKKHLRLSVFDPPSKNSKRRKTSRITGLSPPPGGSPLPTIDPIDETTASSKDEDTDLKAEFREGGEPCEERQMRTMGSDLDVLFKRVDGPASVECSGEGSSHEDEDSGGAAGDGNDDEEAYHVCVRAIDEELMYYDHLLALPEQVHSNSPPAAVQLQSQLLEQSVRPSLCPSMR